MSNNSQSGDSPSTSNYHPEYYLNGGNITFIVEDTIFCVHGYFFERESKSFIENLAKAPRDGTSDRGPFLLENLTSADFATFLWVWYSPEYRLDKRSKDDWLVILELSTRWQFLDMRKLAIEELQNFEIDPVEKIAIYDKYKIDDGLLLLREYKRLCMRGGQMSTEEGETVKLPTVLGIYRARERAIRSAAEKGHHNPAPADVDEEELEHILIEIFNLNICSSARSPHGANNQGSSSDINRQLEIINNSTQQSNNGITNTSHWQTGSSTINGSDTVGKTDAKK